MSGAPLTKTIEFRLSEDQLEQLDQAADQLGLPRSALLRAGLTAVIADPGMVWQIGAPGAGRPQGKRQGSKRRRGR